MSSVATPAYSQDTAKTTETTESVETAGTVETAETAGTKKANSKYKFKAERQIKKFLVSRAAAALSRFIEPDQFHVSARVEIKGTMKESLPYAPRIGGIFGTNFEDENVQENIVSLEVVLSLHKEINKKSAAQLKDILFESLNLSAERNDKITLKTLELTIPRKKEEVEKRLDKTEVLLREAKKDIKRSETDLAESKQKFNALESERDTLDKQLQNLKSQPESTLDLRFWIEKGFIFLVAIFVLGIFFAIAKAISSAIKAIGEGIGSVGTGLEGIAGSIGQMGNKDGDGSSAEPEPEQIEEPIAAIATGGTNQDIKAMRARIVELHSELTTQITPSTEHVLLGHLIRLLRNEPTVPNAVATMELMGAERANLLFNRLPIDSKDRVQLFLDSDGYGSRKYELMLQAGEDLKTKLMQEGFGGKKGADNSTIIERLLTLSDGDIAQLVSALDEDLLPRLFLYLDPIRSASVLKQIHTLDNKVFERTIDVLPNMPQTAARSELDNGLLTKLQSYEEEIQRDDQRPYLNYYLNVVMAMDTNLSELATTRLASSSERVGEFLKSRIVTFSLLFDVDDESLKEIISPMGNREIAALLAITEGEQNSTIRKGVPTRRIEMVEEDFDTLKSLTKRKLNTVAHKAKAKVVKSLTRLKNEGSLGFKEKVSESAGISAA